MRKIDFQEPDNKNWIEWRVKCNKETKVLIKTFNEGKTIKIKKLYKQKDIKLSFFFNKDGPYKGKCSFCEKPITLLDDIDHFRPKKAVNYIENKTVHVLINGVNTKHPGYYWLAYDCFNLLPVCKECNTVVIDENDNKRGKGNRFPVDGDYAITPQEIDSEVPLLINPIVDDPENFFDYDSETGHINVKTNLANNLLKKKAKISIDLLGLDVREDLLEPRREAYERTIYDFHKMHIQKATVDEFRKFKNDITIGIGSHSIARKKALKYISDTINS